MSQSDPFVMFVMYKSGERRNANLRTFTSFTLKFYYIKNICLQKVVCNIYFAFIQSKLTYEGRYWVGTFETILKQTIQLMRL